MSKLDSTSLHTDRYELTMLNAALGDGMAYRKSVFELFARSLPKDREYGIIAGIDRAIEGILNFGFNIEQIEWLIAEGIVSESNRKFLEDFSFTGDVYGYVEGDFYLPHSPVLRVEGTFAECVVMETLLLSIINHDTAVASTGAQMFEAAGGKSLIEMGSRRTHEESAIHSARASYLVGFTATSNLEAGYRYNVPTAGTAAHASILAHEDELEAFISQIKAQGIETTLLVDTYDIKKGILNAVRASNAVGADGPGAIRIDSGDLLLESKKARVLLNDLGAKDTRIVVSGDLDQEKISFLVGNKAPIDAFGIGTRLVTGANCPSPGFVYKLVAIESNNGTMRRVSKKSASKQSSGGTTYPRRMLALPSDEQSEGPSEPSQVSEVLFKQDPTLNDLEGHKNPQKKLVEGGNLIAPPAPISGLRLMTIARISGSKPVSGGIVES